MIQALKDIWEGVQVGFTIVFGFLIIGIALLFVHPIGWVLSAMLLYKILF